MESSKKRLRVIVCGTNFGRIYLNGVKQLGSKCELVGIVSRGSSQSIACADKYNVPLYKSIDEIDNTMVDIVCVAVKSSVTGGKGTEIALKCLEKGISVLQEQPVHYEDVWNCYKMAIKNKCYYSVNSFYSNINAGKTFIEAGRKLLKETKPLCIDAICSMLVLYPLMDMLGKLFGGISPFEVKKISEKCEVLTVVEGRICGVPMIIKVDNGICVEDPDNCALMFHRIVLFTESGQLVLDNSIGLVLWEPRYYIPHAEDGSLDIYGSSEYSKMPVTEILNKEELNNSYQDIYDKIWPQGIANALSDFIDSMDKPLDKKNMQYQLNLCKVWNEVGRALGNAKIIEKPEISLLRANDIMEGSKI